MEFLKERSSSYSLVKRKLPSGKEVTILELQVQFERDIVTEPNSSLPKTYRSKPLVKFNTDVLYGELAILKMLEQAGWDGVWVDTFHGRGTKKVLWNAMPPNGQVTLPSHINLIYDNIVNHNEGKSSGFFDVLAWKNNQVVFIEYKGKGDLPNTNEAKWIEAAINSGIKPEQLFFVSY